jgi:hypothetical protein
MRFARVTALIAGLALSLTPMAAAKGLTKAQACGQSGCAALPRNEEGDGLIQLRGPNGGRLSAPPKAAPYYKLNFTFGRPQDGPSRTITTLFAPSARLVAAPGMTAGSLEWFPISGAVLGKAQNAVRDLEPFGAPQQWSSEIMVPTDLSPTALGSSSNRRAWLRWAFPTAAALFAFALGGCLFRRQRARRLRVPEPA